MGATFILVAIAGCGSDEGGVTAPSVSAIPPITVNASFALSDGNSGDKPKIQRGGDGTLVVVYGDAPDSSRLVYDVKDQAERPARDIFVKTCKPDATKSCDASLDWSPAVNISQSSDKTSIQTEWRGILAPGLNAYPGDIDKANIKTSGPIMVVTWVSKYCPDGDLTTAGLQPPVQRAIRYVERDSRVIPFSCIWMARSTNTGVNWGPAVQLSTGLRDAIQDSSSGSFNTDTRRGQINISWQEDPQGLQLGEAEGPGDGGSGAKVNSGTDVWYAFANVDLSVPGTPADDFVLSPGVRLSDNWQGEYGLPGSPSQVFDSSGANVDPTLLETGAAGASRANIQMVGSTAIVAYEETKGAGGKFIRYHTFPFATPPTDAIGRAGCIISNPQKNARRVRLLTQSPADAGPDGIQLAVFWREGIFNQGGPADIVLRRGMGGIQPTHMVPTLDTACATSDPTVAMALSNAPAENISSRTPNVTTDDNGLADDTEVNAAENAMAHRGVLRGSDLWIGYMYTSDINRLLAQLENYNFWLRKYTFDATAGTGSWNLPQNVSKITDRRINVREPRMFGTPKSNTAACPTGIPNDPTTTDPSLCQDANVIYLAWGTQENVNMPTGGSDLGIYITTSLDAAEHFFAPIRYSRAMGSLFQDEEVAFESQVVTRPDGRRFYGVWNQLSTATGHTVAEYASGNIAVRRTP